MPERTDPTVSVIIPTYERAGLCRQAVDSVLAGTAAHLCEIIVVDDGSRDDLRRALPESVRLVRIGHTGMPGHARNIGVEHARAPLIAFLDSDDLWHPHKLERQLQKAGWDDGSHGGAVAPAGTGQPGAALPGEHAENAAPRPRAVHCRERWVRDGREISQRGQRHRRRGDIFADAVVKCIVGPSTLLIERDAFEEVGRFRPDLEVAEDYEFFVRFLAFEPIEYVGEMLIDKRDRLAPQLSHKHGHIEGFRLRALGDVLADCLDARLAAGDPAAHPARRADAAEKAPGHVAEPAAHPAPRPEAAGYRTRWGRRRPDEVDSERVSLMAAEYARKCRVYARGARKRGREEEAELHERAAACVHRVVIESKEYRNLIEGET